jgi:hypothetical protein
MTSRDRIIACWNGKAPDHVPLTTWCFGVRPREDLAWEKGGEKARFWYSLRMEYIHTLPVPWDLEDDFRRVEAWQSLGVDDMLDVSVPWSMDPEVSWKDSLLAPQPGETSPIMVRKYSTPSGALSHAVRKTGEETAEGWVIQPDHVPLIEDYNIPRAFEHAVSSPADVPRIGHLYKGPDMEATIRYDERMKKVVGFAGARGVPVQAWSAFGMDAVVWFAGIQGAVMMALDDPKTFGGLVDTVAETDWKRTELACSSRAVDLIVQRGWYSSTDFWSPKLFDAYVTPRLKELAGLVHRHGKKFAYVMTTGIEQLGTRLLEAGVDVLYFVDPVQDRIPLERAKVLLGGRMTLVGGTNAVSLASRNRERIRGEVTRAIDVLGPTNRFILHPVDALFPDTPWEGVEILIEAWEASR